MSRENFQEKLENMHQNLLSERQKELSKAIESILAGVQFSDDNQKSEFSRSAREIAEHKHYPVDDKITLLENLKKDNELNTNGGEEQKTRHLYGDISNDIVYQRMTKKGDLENIKLFLERKLPLDTYYSYLTDEEMRKLGNESLFLLYGELQGEKSKDPAQSIEEESSSSTGHSEENKKELSEVNKNSIKEALDLLIKQGIQLSKYTRKDILNAIKYTIYRRTGLSTRGLGKDEFENSGIIIVEENDIPEIAESGDEFNICVYCDLLSDVGGYITVKIVDKPHKLKEGIDLSKFSEEEKNELMDINADLAKVFGENIQDLQNYVDTFVSLRKIGYGGNKIKKKGGPSYEAYCKRSGRDALLKKIKTVSEQYPSIVDTQKRLCEFADKLLREHDDVKMIDVIGKYLVA